MTTSQFTKALPGPLRQPQNLATLISLGFHILVFAGLAAVPLVSANRDNRVVDLVTLTPAEQQQLPQSSAALPPGATDTLPVPLPPGVESYIPGDSALLPVPDMPLPEPPPISMPRRTDFFPAPLGPLLPSPNFPRWTPNNPQWRSPSPSNVGPGPIGPMGPIRLPAPPIGAATPPASPPPEAGGGPVAPPGSNPQMALGTLTTWINQYANKIDQSKLVYTMKTPLAYTYPKAACDQRLTGDVSVVALFDTNGSVLAQAGNPTLTRTSQQAILDQAALRAVADSSFESGGKYHVRTFDFNFQYSAEVCGAGAPAAPASPGSPVPSSPAPSAPSSPGSPPASNPPASGSPAPSPRSSPSAPSPSPSAAPATPADKPSPSAPAASPSPAPAAPPSPAPAAPSPEPAAPPPAPAAPSPAPEAPAPAAPAPSPS